MNFLLALLLSAQAYCPLPHRSRTAVHHFEVQTGYPHGRPGYIVDHIVPLCSCGLDAPQNMQWQTKADAAKKDIKEKALCRSLAKSTKK